MEWWGLRSLIFLNALQNRLIIVSVDYSLKLITGFTARCNWNQPRTYYSHAWQPLSHNSLQSIHSVWYWMFKTRERLILIQNDTVPYSLRWKRAFLPTSALAVAHSNMLCLFGVHGCMPVSARPVTSYCSEHLTDSSGSQHKQEINKAGPSRPRCWTLCQSPDRQCGTIASCEQREI